jgi:hypothetical protein
MALGINTETSGGLDLVPIIKYDARAGRVSRIDRSNTDGSGWTTEQVDITNSFKAVFDLENVETGWMNFNTGGAPDFRLVPLGQDKGQRPSDAHREGFRVMLKLHASCGGDVRELSSQAKAVIGSFDQLHDAYLEGVKKNPGKLPVVSMPSSKPIQTQGPNNTKTTNYAPVFEIVSWVARPADLVFKPKSAATAPKPTGNGTTHASNTASVPPATGATIAAPPPAAKAPQPAMAEDDFG